jgi:hypothetical protein
VIHGVISTAQGSTENRGITGSPNLKVLDLDCADDVVCLFDSITEAQEVLDTLRRSAGRYGMQFAPSKCKVLLQDWIGANPILTVGSQHLEIVNEFTYLGSCTSSDGSVTREISMRISSQPETPVAPERCIFICWWPSIQRFNSSCFALWMRNMALCASDAKQLEVFDHRCLRSVAHIGWSERVSNEYVRKLVFGNGQYRRLAALLKQQRFRWLGHLLRMPLTRFPHQTLFALPELDWGEEDWRSDNDLGTRDEDNSEGSG